MNKQNISDPKDIPKWLRYLLIAVVIFYLLGVALGKRGSQRQDFPTYVK
jgi:hypothetical protein